ncbi:MAG: acyl-CoA thioesterase [Spirochaetae bacterium HGW-Spirochaetae-9]|nr:MAG: acyl-CoA thioesterase [Spirochaetae bacterium HGW-Spirochaetae-9]
MTAKSPYLHKTQYYETDQMGVVHHSNYIRWFEEARTDLLEQAGLGYDKMEERGIIVPVLAASCEYKSSVRYGETVAIIPKVEAYTGLRLTISYRVLDASSGELRAAGETRHAFLDRDFRPSSLKRSHPDVDELMNTLLAPESSL